MYGCEMVCPRPIGNAWSPYAIARSASGTKRWRGTVVMAANTRGSTMSRPRSCCSTISRRAAASDGVSMAGVGSSAREAVTANPTSRRANGPRHARRTAGPLVLVAAGDVVLVLLRRHQRFELVLVVERD